MSREHRSARIVATIGPASADAGTLRQLVAAGVDVARLNMSHGTPEEHRRHVRLVRRAARQAGRPIGPFDQPEPVIQFGPTEVPQLTFIRNSI